MRFFQSLAALTLLSTAAACAVGGSVPDSEEQQEQNEARALTVENTYVVTRQDFRKCAYPMCGGVFVKAVNKAKTTCKDGTKQVDCYVAELDLAALGLPEAQAGEVRAAATAGEVLLKGSFGDVLGIAKLVVDEARDRRTDATPTGTFYFLEASGITCITTPCPGVRARNLNSTSTKLLTDVDFTPMGLSDEEASATIGTIFTEGLVVSGLIKTSGSKKWISVSQVFDRVEPQQQLCLGDDACGAGSYCDMTECLSGCAPPRAGEQLVRRSLRRRVGRPELLLRRRLLVLRRLLRRLLPDLHVNRRGSAGGGQLLPAEAALAFAGAKTPRSSAIARTARSAYAISPGSLTCIPIAPRNE
jgi:hypothetical protein